jgi:hypothetical protein
VLLELAAWLQAGEDRAITAGSQVDVKTGCPCLRAVAPGAPLERGLPQNAESPLRYSAVPSGPQSPHPHAHCPPQPTPTPTRTCMVHGGRRCQAPSSSCATSCAIRGARGGDLIGHRSPPGSWVQSVRRRAGLGVVCGSGTAPLNCGFECGFWMCSRAAGGGRMSSV